MIGPEGILRRIGAHPHDRFDLAEGALALAALDHGPVDLSGYRRHLTELARDVAAAAQGKAALADQVAALNRVLVEGHGYRGDAETYDDLQNADLMRVIDRRRGLPVAIGILYIHAARAQGWDMVGLAFPFHFLVRLETPAGQVIVDPFNAGATPDPATLRQLLEERRTERPGEADHTAPVSDRAILLRLQNNVKVRLINAARVEDAVAVIRRMLMFAPDLPELWRELALSSVHLGRIGDALAAIDGYLARAGGDRNRARMTALAQSLRRQLN